MQRAADAGAGDAGLGDGPAALCLARCTLGGPEADKCGDEGLAACAPLDGGGDGFCRPLCTRDEDCEPQRCDRRHGVCVDRAPAEDTTFGEACDPNASHCDGLCVALDEAYAACGQRCVFGDSRLCGTDTRRGGCVLVTPGGGIGDIGFCAELCDCDADCRHADALCDAFDDQELERVFGRAGVCVGPTLALSEGIACGS